jgi:hypothetical protein
MFVLALQRIAPGRKLKFSLSTCAILKKRASVAPVAPGMAPSNRSDPYHLLLIMKDLLQIVAR